MKQQLLEQSLVNTHRLLVQMMEIAKPNLRSDVDKLLAVVVEIQLEVNRQLMPDEPKLHDRNS